MVRPYPCLTVRAAHVEIESRVERIAVVQHALAELLAERDVGERARDRLALAVGEAVANAIVHGNASDPGRRVVVDLALDGDELSVDVRDEGAGFDPQSVADPRASERLLARGGRGVLLMRDAMDVTCSRGPAGSVVRLRASLVGRPATFTSKGAAHEFRDPSVR